MKNIKQKIYIAIVCVLAVIGTLCGIFIPDHEINNTIDELQNIVQNQIVITEEVKTETEAVKEITENGEDISTTEIIESSEEEEKEVVDESAIENDAVVEQENISYDGVNTGNGLSLLGAYQGLTYYSQADSRWANIMYSSKGDRSQTMKSSACGPTSAAMIVSSSKGAILPTTMANLSVNNGYRTANNGTAWSFYPFVADYFNFNEYHTTSNFDTAMNYLSQKREDGSQKYYAIVSCGSGIWTTGGHYIVIASVDGDQIKVFDPYLYNGKFNTASRRVANVTVSGNSAYLTRGSFRAYSNYKSFFIYSNDSALGKVTENSNVTAPSTNTNYTRYVATQSANLNVRRTANGAKVGSLKKGTAVTVVETSGGWSRISSPISGWVSTAYLSSAAVKTTNNTTANQGATKPAAARYTTGSYKVTSNLNVRDGAGTKYRAKKSSQLTANARQQNARLGGAFNGYRKGVICKVTKVSGNWGLTSSGWICLSYCKKQ